MSLSVGIVGLPNVGKSTLFNALTNQKVDAQNYPFCTIDPNVGIVPVPDERLIQIAFVIEKEKSVYPPIINAVVEFVDIAGLVKGAAEGEGLGNKFLSHIKETDVIVHLVRMFEDDNIIHVNGQHDPIEDIDIIRTELLVKDIETVNSTIKKNEKLGKFDKEINSFVEVLKNLESALSEGNDALEYIQSIELEEDILKKVKQLHLITAKPVIYCVNVDEQNVGKDDDYYREKLNLASDAYVVEISAKLENELLELDDNERKQYLNQLGIEVTGLEKMVQVCYKLLGLISFFTAGEKEVRAWTITDGMKVDVAAGVIHTDFMSNFIKADVVHYPDFVGSSGWNDLRAKGKVKVEGRDYTVQDGDVIIIKHNAN